MKLVWSAVIALGLVACTRTSETRTTSVSVGETRPNKIEVTETPKLVTHSTTSKAFAVPATDVSWVLGLEREKSFQVVRDFEKTSDAPLEISWTIHPSVKWKDAPPDEDYPSLYSAKVELTFTRGNVTKTFDLGDHSGFPDASGLSACKREKWKTVASAFGLVTMQGGDEWMMLYGHDGYLHVITRHTHDGACPVLVKQGPFEVCADMKWEQAFDIPISGNVNVVESANHLDNSGTKTPVDCKLSYYGDALDEP